MASKVSDTEPQIHARTAHMSDAQAACSKVINIAGFVQCATLGEQFQDRVPDLGLRPGFPWQPQDRALSGDGNSGVPSDLTR